MAVGISLSITQNSQDVTKNTSNVTVKVTASCTGGSYNALGTSSGSITIDGTKYSFSGISYNTGEKSSWSGVVMTKTVNISHNSDGTKKLSCSATFDTRVSSGVQSCSGSKILTTIPRKSTLSVSNGTLGTAQTLTVTRQSTSFTHTIVAKCGSTSTAICTKSTSTSIKFTPPLSLASQNTTGTSVSITYTITTYNGSTSIGSNSYTKTCSIPSSVKPSVSITVTDPMGYADTYGGYLKGLSKFKVVVTATQSYGSAISSYKTTANGSTYTASSFTTGVLSSSGTLKVSSTVTDKRNRTETASKSLTVLDYSKPLITALSVHRCDQNGTANDQGEYVKVVFSSAVTSLSSKNTAEYKLEYKKTSASTYTAVTLTDYANNYSVSSGSYIFAADSGSSYNVRVIVTDNFDSGSKATSASTGFTIMHWLASGLGMAIGKVAELANVLDIGFKTRLSGGLLYPTLEPKTDLDDVKTPNFYAGLDIKTNEYVNCPLTDGSFTLVVYAAGGSGQARQYIEECDKVIPEKYERYLYPSSGWGEWIKLSPTDLTQTITYVPSAVNTYELVGSITIPSYKYFTVTVRGIFNNATCKGITIGENNTSYKQCYAAAINEDVAVHFPSCTYSGYTGSSAKTLYIWGKWAGTNTNTVRISGFYIPH